MIHRSLFSAVFIPHEYCTPHNIVHPSTWGFYMGSFPPLQGLGGSSPQLGGPGESRPPAGVQGTMFLDGGLGKSPEGKISLVNVYCNFIVNMDRSL
jgi:hypothetical protein